MPIPRAFRDFRHIVVLTGAGVSAASGLRTYRGPQGVWDEHDVERLGNAQALVTDPTGAWSLWGGLRKAIQQASPNAAHRALAAFEGSLPAGTAFTLITQNVDGLHQQAGSRNVIELHGSISQTRCSRAGCAFPEFTDTADHAEALPMCPVCGSVLRPGVTLFGEALPALASWNAKRAMRDVDLFVAIGTSGLVEPASRFSHWARDNQAHTVLLNLEQTRGDASAFAQKLFGAAEETVPRYFGVPY